MKSASLLLLLVINISLIFAQGQFKIRNDAYIQIGYTGYKALTFGQSTGSPNNGNFAIEHCTGCSPAGLNIWKPWPTSGAANYLFFMRDNGNIGIGNSGDASYKLQISGQVRANAYHTFSDERLKENFQPDTSVLNNLNQINVYKYTYMKTNAVASDSLSVNVSKSSVPYTFDDKLHHGIKAQELQLIYPELVTEDENGYLSINYVELIPILLRAIQEQNERIAALETIKRH